MTQIRLHSQNAAGEYSNEKRKLEVITTGETGIFLVARKIAKQDEHEFDIASAAEIIEELRYFTDDKKRSILAKVSKIDFSTSDGQINANGPRGIEYAEPEHIGELLRIAKPNTTSLEYFYARMVLESESAEITPEFAEKVTRELSDQIEFEKQRDGSYRVLDGHLRILYEKKPHPYGPCLLIDTQNYSARESDARALKRIMTYLQCAGRKISENPVFRFYALWMKFSK